MFRICLQIRNTKKEIWKKKRIKHGIIHNCLQISRRGTIHLKILCFILKSINVLIITKLTNLEQKKMFLKNKKY